MDRPGLEVGQLHAMQPSLHAAARVVGPKVLQTEFTDMPDAVLDDPVAFLSELVTVGIKAAVFEGSG